MIKIVNPEDVVYSDHMQVVVDRDAPLCLNNWAVIQEHIGAPWKLTRINIPVWLDRLISWKQTGEHKVYKVLAGINGGKGYDFPMINTILRGDDVLLMEVNEIGHPVVDQNNTVIFKSMMNEC